MNPPYPLACLDTPRHHSLVMQLVVMGLVLLPLVLKPRLQLRSLVLLLRSSFLALAICPLLILLRKPLIKKEGPLLKMSAP